MRRLVLLLWLTGCPGADTGAPCTRNSDCASNMCGASSTCTVEPDAGVEVAIDANGDAGLIPPLDAEP